MQQAEGVNCADEQPRRLLETKFPKAADELEILRTQRGGYDGIMLNPVVTRGDVLKLQAVAQKVFVEESVLDYILKIVTATRTEAEFRAGVSVRGGLALRTAAQARALVHGRDFVLPEDVEELVVTVLAHRLGRAMVARGRGGIFLSWWCGPCATAPP